ncbi:MAG: CHAT domain-containing protein [Flavobacteriaceae bacterium]|nr:CHAT domain-containing protein [Flavobacteriaceae bacterium]
MKILKAYTCIWLCTWFLSSNVHSQNFFETYKTLSKQERPEKQFRSQVDSLVSKCRAVGKFEEAARITHEYSIRSYRMGNFENAIAYGDMEIEDLEKLDPLPETWSRAVYNVGLFYHNIGEYLTAIPYHKKVTQANLNPTRVAQSNCEMGRAYTELGDYYKALDFYREGISALEEQEAHRILVSKYINLAKVLEKINTPKSLSEKLKVLHKAEALKEVTYFNKFDHYTLNNSFATFYNNPIVFNPQKAKFYYAKNLERAFDNQDSTFVSASYINLADLYNQQKKDSALHYAKLALPYNPNAYHTSLTYHQMSKYHEHRGEWEASLQAIQNSISQITGVGTNIAETPNVVQLEKANDKVNLLLALTDKAEVLGKWYEEDKDEGKLHWALETLKAADQIVDLLTISSSENQSKLYWRKEAVQVYPLAIGYCELLEANDLAFYFSEKSKSILLLGSIVQNTEQGKLPKDVLSQQTELRREIFKMESRQDELSKEEASQLFGKKQSYSQLVDSLSTDYPEYAAQNLQPVLLSLEEVKNALDANTVVLSYVQGLDKTSGVFLSSEKQLTFSLGNQETLESLLVRLRDLAAKPLETQEEWQAYYNVAHEAFQFLFPTEVIQQSLTDKHLIIVPDGNLQSIPFEALIPNLATKKFLIETTKVSYAYSLSLLKFNSEIKRRATLDFIGFAPNEFKNESLSALPKTASEISDIQEVMGGITFQNEEASKATFLTQSGDHKIIHLATHANASGNPWIAFQEGALQLHELYTARLEADLVVLSACNTSLGTYAEGEGVMGLTRGFFYSGANTVVSSLWNANDKSTASIMKDFYGSLKKGTSKVDALHRAKLNYIKTHSLSQKSPFYWAAFVIHGDTQPSFQKASVWIYGMILFLASLLLLIYLKNRKKAKS